MKLRRVFTAVGAGVSTFFFVAIAIVTALDVEFSVLVGLPVGLRAGAGVLEIHLPSVDDAAATRSIPIE